MLVKKLVIIQILASAVLFFNTAEAAPLSFNVDGVISDSSDNPLEAASVTFKIQIKDSTETCLLYQESFPVSMTGSNGYFSLVVGKQTNAVSGGTTLDKVFSNVATVIPGQSCTYTPSSTSETRKIIVSFDAGSGDQVFTTQEIQSVPYAVEAGQATKFTGSLSGDVSGSQTSTVVGKIQGQPVDMTGIADGKILKYQSGSFVVADDAVGTSGITSLNGLTTAIQTFGAIDLGNSVLAPAWLSSGSAHTLKIPMASGTGVTGGLISNSDYANFSNKVTGLSGDVTATGPGVANATIGAGKVTSSHILDGTILGTDMDFTGTNAATAGAVIKDASGKFLTLNCATTGHVLTWSATGWSCAAVPSAGLPTTGGTMSGAIDMGNQNLLNVGNITMVPGGYLQLPATTTAGTLAGQVWYDTGVIKYWDGSAVKTISTGTSGMSNALASGAIWVGNASGGAEARSLTGDIVNVSNTGSVTVSKSTSGAVNTIVALDGSGVGTMSGLTLVNSGQVTLSASTASNTYGLKLPAASPVGNQILQVDAFGNFTWITTPSFSMPALNSGLIWIGNASNGATAKAVTGDATIDATGNLVLSNTTVTAGTYPKVTTDSKGRITAGSNLSPSDVTTGLGYTPVNKSGDTMSGDLSTQTVTIANGKYLGLGSTGTPGSVAGQMWYDSGNIKYWDGSATKTLGVSGAGITAINGLTNATQSMAVGTAGTDVNLNSAGFTHTINVPDASASARGALTSADWSTFNAKQSNTLASGNLLVGNASGGAQARVISGDITIDSVGSTALKNVGTAGTYHKVTTDAQGRITSGAALASGDVTTALTYTPLNRAADTMTGDLGTQNINMAANKYLRLSNNTTDGSVAGQMWYDSTSNVIKYWNGSAAQTLGVAGAGITSLNGLTGPTQTFGIGTTGTAPNFVSAGNGHILHIPLASTSGTVTHGLISNAEYVALTGKQSNALASGQLWVGNTSGGAQGRTISGDITIDSVGSTALKNVGTVGTYHKVTTDAQGRVVSGAALASGDVTTALGYTPASPANTFTQSGNAFGATAYLGTTDAHSLGFVTGSTERMIIDVNGRVGIGTSTPSTSLDLSAQTDAIIMPKGTTAARPSTTTSGMIRYNTTNNAVEYHNGTTWLTVGNALGYTPVNKAGDTMGGLLNHGGFDITNTGNITMAANKYFQLSANSTSGTTAGQVWYDAGTIKYFDGTTVKSLGVAGAGITSLNGLSGTTQTFGATTTGTDFTISSSGNGHIFNLPSASSSARGALTSTDWTTFNNKQSNALTAGQIWVGNASNGAQAFTLSGDIASVSNTGGVVIDKTTLGTADKILALDNTGVAVTYGLSMKGSIAGGVNLLPAANGGTYSLNFPNAQGGANQVLANNGGGTLSWVTPLLPSSITNNATLASGKMWIGNASGVAVPLSITGDATVDNTGGLTLATVPVAKGGTGTTSLTAGSILVGAGTGAVSTLAGGTSGNVMWATGAATWASGSPDTAGLVDKTNNQTVGGNKTFSGTTTIANGTLTNTGFSLGTASNVITAGNGHIAAGLGGTSTTGGGQIYAGAYAQTGSTIDFNKGNTQVTSYDCAGGSINLTNMQSGGNYTLIVISTTTPKCTLQDNGTNIVDTNFTPTNSTRAAGFITIYRIVKVGNTAYGQWGSVGTTPATGFLNGGNTYAGNANIGLTDNYNLNVLTNGAVRMTINNAGNVGIGTQAPASSLDLSAKTDAVALPKGATASRPSTLVSGMVRYNTTNSMVEFYDGGGWYSFGKDLGYTPLNKAGDSMSGVLDMGSSNIINSGNIGIGTNAPAVALDAGSKTDAIRLPNGTTAQRPTSTAGLIRYNTTNNNVEYNNGSTWVTVGVAGAGITAINGSTNSTQSFAVPATGGTAMAWSTNTGTGLHSLTIPLASTASAIAGLISNTDYLTFNAKQSNTLAAGSIWVGNATNGAEARALTGDVASVSGTGVVTVNKTTTGTVNTILSLDGSGVANAKGLGLINSGTVYLQAQTASSTYTLKLPAASPAASQIMVSDAAGNLSWVTNSAGLGYTPVNRAGDTMSGVLNHGGYDITNVGNIIANNLSSPSMANLTVNAGGAVPSTTAAGGNLNLAAQSATGYAGGNILMTPGSGTTKGSVIIGGVPDSNYLLIVGATNSPTSSYFTGNSSTTAVGSFNSNATGGTAGQFVNVQTGAFAKIASGNYAAIFNTMGTSPGYVGIGTSTPTSKLHVSDASLSADPGGTYITSNTAMSTYASGSSSTDFIANQVSADVGSGAGPVSGITAGNFRTTNNMSYNVSTATGTSSVVTHSGSGTMATAIGTISSVRNTGSNAITSAYGGQFSSQLTSTGSIGNSYGASFSTVSTSGGNITNAYGGNFLVNNASTGTITTATAGNFQVLNSTGTIGTGYGIYIGNISATTKYSIYSNDASTSSYIAGNVGIGTIPTSKLDVSSTAANTIRSINSTSIFAAGNFQNTGSSAQAFLAVNNDAVKMNGHLSAAGDTTAPTLVGCTGATITGNDTRGTFTFGSTTSCTITYSKPFTNNPVCIIGPASNPGSTNFWVSSTSATTMIFNVSTASAGLKLHYFCVD